MPYYIGDVIKHEKALIARTPERFRETGVDVRIDTRVVEVDTGAGMVRLCDGTALPYDLLVVATGTVARMPGIPGEGLEGVFTLKSYTDALAIKAWLRERRCRQVTIVGAGFIGMEMAESLCGLGIGVQLLHRSALPVNRWDPEFSRVLLGELGAHGVDFAAETEPTAIEAGKTRRLRVVTNRGESEADMVLLATGTRPDVALAQQIGLPLGASGAIRVNFSQRTAIETVYAAGDCAESFHRVSGRWVNLPLGDIANKQGRVAGRNIGGGAIGFPGVVGAQSFRLFALEVAATGLDEREAADSGFHPVSVLLRGGAIAGPMPGNTELGLKLIADRATGRLLGAQAVGQAGAVSRINALSMALWAGMTVDDAGYVDLAYAPPFGGSWDLIHVAAQALRRKL